MKFVDDELLAQLPEMSREALDDLPFGVIKVDAKGVIEVFSQYETNFSGVAAEAAEGRNFFTQVAPCTNNSLFLGRFKKGLSRGQLNCVMPYTYTYKMRPTNVFIHLYHDSVTDTNWILTKKRE